MVKEQTIDTLDKINITLEKSYYHFQKENTLRILRLETKTYLVSLEIKIINVKTKNCQSCFFSN